MIFVRLSMVTSVLAMLASLGASPLKGYPANLLTQSDRGFICENAVCQSVAFDYLLVTRPIFVESLREFVEWKTSLGFRVGLVTVEWLDQTFEGRHMAERMKTGMHFLRQQSGVRYVLLVGDTSIANFDFSISATLESYSLDEPWNVPTGYYRRLASDPVNEILPSDVYFVEDRDWDANGVGATPITNDENGGGSLDATLFVGRWALRSPEEIEPIVAKTMSVTRTDRVLFTVDQSLLPLEPACPDEWPPLDNPEAPPPPFKEFFCYLDTMIKARSVFDASAWLTSTYQPTEINDEAESATARSMLLDSEGAVVISYHGGHDCMMLDSRGCESATNWPFKNVFTLLEAESCIIATFYFADSDSLGEILLKRGTGPALVTQAPNPYLFLVRLRKGESVGEALWRSAEAYLYWPNPIMLLGDPSLPVFVEIPKD